MKYLQHFISALLVFVASGYGHCDAQTIRLEGDVWPPYVMDPGSGKKGYMVDIAEAVFARAGYRLSFAAVPWSRALVETERGESDGIVGIYFSQAKDKKFVVPSEELGISQNHLFVRSDSDWTYSGIGSLRAMTLGAIANYDYGELNEYIRMPANQRSEVLQITSGNDALEKNLRKLVSGRISVLIEDLIVARYIAQQIGVDRQIKPAGSVPPRNPVGIAFSASNPKSAEYARILSDGVLQLRKSGELKVILDSYQVADWKVSPIQRGR